MELSKKVLSLTQQFCPAMGKTLREHESQSLSGFLNSIGKNGPNLSFQSREDLFDLIFDEVEQHSSTEMAHLFLEELRANPLIPTSNHCGMDTAADSIQGSLLFLLSRGQKSVRRAMVVLAFGSISMNNNFSYPMGLLFYDHHLSETKRLPQKLTIFSNRARRKAVFSSPRLDREMVLNALDNCLRLKNSGKLTELSYKALTFVLEAILLDERVLSQNNYIAQSQKINSELWEHSFDSKIKPGPFIQLNIESLTTQLLYKDLTNNSSLIHQLFFEPKIRENLLAELEGKKACWSLESNSGTVFFWGLNETGHRVALKIISLDEQVLLVPMGKEESNFKIKFSRLELIEALKEGKIIPSLFTCFTVIAFARGMECVGGYYQREYLPLMQEGIIRAMSHLNEYKDGVSLISSVPSRTCLAGLQWLAIKRENHSLLPIGPVELSALGGIRQEHLKSVETVSVQEAHLQASLEFFDQMVPKEQLPDNWVSQLSLENGASRHFATFQDMKREL